MDEIKQKIKAIIFDMDGTIIDTERAWRNVTIESLKAFGVKDFTPEQEKFLGTLPGMGLSNAVAAIKDYFKLNISVEELIAYKIQLANFHLSQDIDFIKGFQLFHARLQQHAIPSGIATNSSLENLKRIDQKMNLKSFFGDNIYCVADVENKAKPDPALFLHTAKKLGANPAECIVFEDSIYGFQAAKAAGMKCIAIKNKFNGHLLNEVYDAIESYHEAEEVLKKI